MDSAPHQEYDLDAEIGLGPRTQKDPGSESFTLVRLMPYSVARTGWRTRLEAFDDLAGLIVCQTIPHLPRAIYPIILEGKRVSSELLPKPVDRDRETFYQVMAFLVTAHKVRQGGLTRKK